MPGSLASGTCCSPELCSPGGRTAQLYSHWHCLLSVGSSGCGDAWPLQPGGGFQVCDTRSADLASELAVTDTVNKCENPRSWWLTNAHEEKQRFTFLPSRHFFSLCKMFGWMTLGGVLLIRMVVQGQQTSCQSRVYSRLWGKSIFFHVFILNS